MPPDGAYYTPWGIRLTTVIRVADTIVVFEDVGASGGRYVDVSTVVCTAPSKCVEVDPETQTVFYT